MARSIDIQITKGKIESFSVELKEDLPVVTATVGLFTADNKKISSFSIGSANWMNDKFEVPPEMIQPILDISQDLERIVMNRCNSMMGRLEAPKPEKEKKVEPINITPMDIDLSKGPTYEEVETPLGEQIDNGAEIEQPF